MERINFTIILLFVLVSLKSQDYNYGFLVEFTDKNNTEYSTERPLEFLSQKAINRRLKYNIQITDEDLPVNYGYADSLQNYNAKLHNTSKWFNSAVYFTDNEQFGADVENVSFVSNTRLIYRKETKLTVKRGGNKSIKNTSNEQDAFYGASSNQIKMCNGNKLHSSGYLGEGITIAVIDAGFFMADNLRCFDSLFVNNRVLGTYDFVKNENNVYEDHSHGQKVLSIIASNLRGELMGAAPNANYWLLRSEDANTENPIEEDFWIFAAEYADSVGADIITSSLGYNNYDDSTMSWIYSNMDGATTRITQAAEKAFSKGMFLVSSAGNEGNNDWKYITAPADAPNVLTVGAVDPNKVLASFSSVGPSSDGRTKPDVVGQGAATALFTDNGDVATGNGTSFSCPLIAGLVACLWQVNPNISNSDLLTIIRKSSDSFSQPNNLYGYGIPNFEDAKNIVKIDDFLKSKSSKIIDVYPNPFNDELSLTLFIAQKQPIQVSIHNMLGQKVFSQGFNFDVAQVEVLEFPNCNFLEKGIYILSVETNDKILSQIIAKE